MPDLSFQKGFWPLEVGLAPFVLQLTLRDDPGGGKVFHPIDPHPLPAVHIQETDLHVVRIGRRHRMEEGGDMVPVRLAVAICIAAGKVTGR